MISDLTDADIQLEADNQALVPGAGVAQNNIFAKPNPAQGLPLDNVNPIDGLTRVRPLPSSRFESRIE